jgi:multimeric flavodoxin WrbA
MIFAANVKVNGCIGCNACYSDEKHRCIQKDDMEQIYAQLKDADAIVIATPVYFYNVSSQLKCIIDRLHNPIRDEFKVKTLFLLTVAADTDPAVFDSIKVMYRSVLHYFHLKDGGMITVPGVKTVGILLGIKLWKKLINSAKLLNKGVAKKDSKRQLVFWVLLLMK